MTRNSASLSTPRRGFTLVEMLVSITIMLLMVGGGIAGYIQFNDRQIAVAAGSKLQSYLRLAQTKARSGDVPSGCTQLTKYSVRLTNGSNQIQLYAVCSNGDVLVQQDTFDPSVSPTTNHTINFRVLHGGIEGAGTVTLQKGSTFQYTLDISAGGEISHGEVTQI